MTPKFLLTLALAAAFSANAADSTSKSDMSATNEAAEPQVVTKTVTTTTTTGDVTRTVVVTETTEGPVKEPEKAKVKFTPVGRLLLDAAGFLTNDDEIKSGVGMPDVRLGTKVEYKDWFARIELGYSYSKLSLMDVYLQKNFKAEGPLKGYLRIGQFIPLYGLQSAYSSGLRSSMEDPTPNAALGYNYLLGAAYVANSKPLLVALTLHAESQSAKMTPSQMIETGYGAMLRLAWRPKLREGLVTQIGISGAFSGPQYSDDEALNHNHYAISANFPTRVDKVKAVSADVTEARNLLKFTPELLLASGPLALESQYYWFQVNRKQNLAAYRAYGAYGLLRFLARGGNYAYNQANGAMVNPSAGSVELALGYNYTCLTHQKAGLWGGRMSDLSLTASWYINKYVTWRVRAGYTHRWDRRTTATPLGEDTQLGSLQTRLQIFF